MRPVVPNIYTATARILPPQQGQSSSMAMLGQLGSLAGAAGGALGIKNPNDLYIGMMKSRTLTDNIVARFKLKEVYKLTQNLGVTEESQRRLLLA